MQHIYVSPDCQPFIKNILNQHFQKWITKVVGVAAFNPKVYDKIVPMDQADIYSLNFHFPGDTKT